LTIKSASNTISLDFTLFALRSPPSASLPGGTH
jgi:hypothetical protein